MSWTPQYSRWRHGGWYVDNIRYPGGAVGCVSRNYPDKKWRIVCNPYSTYPTRDSAARAERVRAITTCACGHRPFGLDDFCGECGVLIDHDAIRLALNSNR